MKNKKVRLTLEVEFTRLGAIVRCEDRWLALLWRFRMQELAFILRVAPTGIGVVFAYPTRFGSNGSGG